MSCWGPEVTDDGWPNFVSEAELLIRIPAALARRMLFISTNLQP